MPLTFAVLGPGGVGGLLGGLLARVGNPVQLIASEETCHAIGGRLRVESALLGDFQVGVHTATRLEGPVDACLITVKSNRLRAALQRVPADVVGRGLIIPFLNGVDHVEVLRSIYPPSSVVPATIRIETTRLKPGLIRHTSPFASIEMATSDLGNRQVGLVAEQFQAAGLKVRVRDEETIMLWEKLAMLAPLALLTTHEHANVGVIRSRRREDAVAVISEVAAVARAQGAAADPEAILRVFDSAPETMGTSMQRDQAAGLPLELDAIGGAVLRHAAQFNIAVPVTARLYEEIRRRLPKEGA